MLETLTIGAALFASTNIDDIFLLMAFFSDPRLDRRAVVAGQYAGIGALVAASVLAAACAVAVPGHWIALLGLAPLAIGLHRLWSSWRGGEAANADDDAPRPAGSGFLPQVCSVAGVTAANGGDNIGVYVPVFPQDFGRATAVCRLRGIDRRVVRGWASPREPPACRVLDAAVVGTPPSLRPDRARSLDPA